MDIPHRIQRRRAKGWRLPPNTVYVGRPTIWGNPFPLSTFTPEEAVKRYEHAIAHAPIDHYMALVTRIHRHLRLSWIAEVRARLPELRGKHLACWCPLHQPCHADVLLELANR